MSVVWASRILGRPLPERVTGIDLMNGMLERGNGYGYRCIAWGRPRKCRKPSQGRSPRNTPTWSFAAGERIFHRCGGGKHSGGDIALPGRHPVRRHHLPEEGEIPGPVQRKNGSSGSATASGVVRRDGGKVERAPDRWQRLGLEWLYGSCRSRAGSGSGTWSPTRCSPGCFLRSSSGSGSCHAGVTFPVDPT